MQNFRKTLIASGLCLLVSLDASTQTDDTEEGIGALMSAEQYRAAGLDKLSDTERDSLYRWLQNYAGDDAAPQPKAIPAATVPPVPATPPPPSNESQAIATAPEKNFGFPDPPGDPEEPANQLHARVLEPFRGWDGKTLFYLDNGQVWRQRTNGRHTYSGDDNRVVISENRFGFYEMRLIAVDRSVGVKRIK